MLCSIEDVAANTTKLFWFQLYVMGNGGFIEPRRPLIIAGNGARWERACRGLTTLAEGQGTVATFMRKARATKPRTFTRLGGVRIR
jgi:hypothetical protein